MSVYVDKLKSFGVPDIIPNAPISQSNRILISDFIVNNANVAVVGDKHYEYCIKMIRLKLAYNPTLLMRFTTQNSIYVNGYNAEVDTTMDSLFITEISGDSSDLRKRSLSRLIDLFVSNKKQIIIGSDSVRNLKEALEYNWHTIDLNFEVMKV